jgi:hypothetical protein
MRMREWIYFLYFGCWNSIVGQIIFHDGQADGQCGVLKRRRENAVNAGCHRRAQ